MDKEERKRGGVTWDWIWRLPMGLLFTILGLLLAGYGVIADRAIYARSLGWNVNLSWGVCLFVFGLLLLLLTRRAARLSGTETPTGK